MTVQGITSAGLAVRSFNGALNVPMVTFPNGTPARALQYATALADVVSFGAVGDGVTDDAAAINAAIASLPALTGGVVFFKNGNYRVASAVAVTNQKGVHLLGESRYATRILGTSAIQTVTLPNGETTGAIVKFLNCAWCSVENLSIASNATSAAPPSCIESRRDDLGHQTTHLRTQNCLFGSPDGFWNLHGIRYTCADSTTDANNDDGEHTGNTVQNLRGAALSIEHSNSEFHRWIGGDIGATAWAARVRGGSFNMLGTGMGNVGAVLNGTGTATAMVDFGSPTFNGVGGYAPAYNHASLMMGCSCEGADSIINTDTFPYVQMEFIGGGVIGMGSPVAVNFLSVGNGSGNSRLTFRDFTLISGAATSTCTMGSATSQLVMDNCNGVGFTNVTFAGNWFHRNNQWLPGSPTFTPSNGAVERYECEMGGGFVVTDSVARTRTGGAWVNAPFAVAPTTYTLTNHSDSRSLDETGATLAQLAHVVGTLINDLKLGGGPK